MFEITVGFTIASIIIMIYNASVKIKKINKQPTVKHKEKNIVDVSQPAFVSQPALRYKPTMGYAPPPPPPQKKFTTTKKIEPINYVFEVNTDRIRNDLKNMSVEDMQYLLKHIEDISVIINQEMIEKV